MAQTLEHLSRQSATLGSIRGIVHTMKTLAAINAHPYEQAAHAIDEYHQTVRKALAAFVRAHGFSRPQPATTRAQLVVVFGSDHGLCGSYNEQLAQQVRAHAQSTNQHEIRFTMEANKLLAALLRSHLFASLYYASAMAMVTENAARLSLMQQAEQSVDERLLEVNQDIAQARQDEITHELMDIVIGHHIKK